MLKYDGIDYDLNNLFQFEMLKKLIEAIAKNQIQMDEKMQGILIQMSNPNTNTNPKFSSNAMNNQNATDEEEPESDDKEEDPNNIDIDNESLNKRISAIERKLNTLKTHDKQIKSLTAKTDTINDSLSQTIIKVTEHTNQITSNTNDLTDVKETLTDIQNKMSDYNMYSMFKDSSEGNDNGVNLDTTKGVILNLETKIFKKFSLIDERNKKSEEDNMKSKAEVANLKNGNELMAHQINQLQEDLGNRIYESIKDNTEKESKSAEVLNKLNEEMNTRLKQLEEFNEELNGKLKETEENLMKSINAIQKDISSSSIHQSENGNKTIDKEKEKEQRHIRDITRRVIELEKGQKAIKDSLIFDEIKDELDKLQDAIRKRLVKDDLSNINDTLVYIETNITGIKDFNEICNSSIKSHATELGALSKRIENLTAVIISMQDGGVSGSGLSGSYTGGRPPLVDLSKYTDMQLFNQEINAIKASLSELTEDSNEYRRKISDLMPLLTTVAYVSDVKALELKIFNSIEEINQLNIKKYCDKSEMNKKMKVIDGQIRQAITELKKKDKGDNWMLASKPMVGYKCASCENEIEDLNNNKWEYLPWKKYPLKNFADKSYRMGNGFSHLLQKMSLEMTRNNNDYGGIALSDSESEEKKKRNSSEDKAKKRRKSPKVKSNQLDLGIGVSGNEIKRSYVRTEHSGKKGNRMKNYQHIDSKEKEPKVVKIYKKIKQVNDDVSIYNKYINDVELDNNSNDKDQKK